MPLQRTRSRASLGRSPLNGGSLGGLVFILAIGLAGAARGVESPSPGPRLIAIALQGFDSETGQLIDDLSDHGWNQLDFSILAKVELGGPASGPVRLDVTVLNGKELVLKRRLQTLVDSPRRFVPVWVDGPFCEDVTIHVQLVGTEQKLEKQQAFRCGE
jgi:hypothetical protein